MSGTSEWPFPSDSRRVSAFFYLADGLLIGGGLVILLGLVVFTLFLLYRSLLDGFVSTGTALVLVLVGYLVVLRATAFREWSRTAPDDPPAATDWAETREWATKGVVVLLVACGGLGLLVGLWTLSRGWALLASFLLPFVAVLLGLTFRLYGFHRLGVRVL